MTTRSRHYAHVINNILGAKDESHIIRLIAAENGCRKPADLGYVPRSSFLNEDGSFRVYTDADDNEVKATNSIMTEFYLLIPFWNEKRKETPGITWIDLSQQDFDDFIEQFPVESNSPPPETPMTPAPFGTSPNPPVSAQAVNTPTPDQEDIAEEVIEEIFGHSTGGQDAVEEDADDADADPDNFDDDEIKQMKRFARLMQVVNPSQPTKTLVEKWRDVKRSVSDYTPFKSIRQLKNYQSTLKTQAVLHQTSEVLNRYYIANGTEEIELFHAKNIFMFAVALATIKEKEMVVVLAQYEDEKSPLYQDAQKFFAAFNDYYNTGLKQELDLKQLRLNIENFKLTTEWKKSYVVFITSLSDLLFKHSVQANPLEYGDEWYKTKIDDALKPDVLFKNYLSNLREQEANTVKLHTTLQAQLGTVVFPNVKVTWQEHLNSCKDQALVLDNEHQTEQKVKALYNTLRVNYGGREFQGGRGGGRGGGRDGRGGGRGRGGRGRGGRGRGRGRDGDDASTINTHDGNFHLSQEGYANLPAQDCTPFNEMRNLIQAECQPNSSWYLH